MADLSDSDIERIVSGLATQLGTGEQQKEGEPPGDPEPLDWGDFFDDDVDEADVAAFFAEADGGGDFDDFGADLVGAGIVGGETDLSNPTSPQVYDLAQQNAALAEQVNAMQAEVSEAKWSREREALLSQGVPPALLDLAAPVLEAEHQGAVIDLSHSVTGQRISPAQVIRQLLGHAAGYVDLSAEVGHGAPSTSQDAGSTDAMHSAWEAQYGKAKS